MGAAMINPDIRITPEGGSAVLIPVNPEKIQIGADAKFLTFSTITKDVKIPNGISPEEVSWSGVFYGHARKATLPMKTWETPNVLRQNISRWRDKGAMITLEITGIKITGNYHIASFKGKYSGAYGDFYYDIKLVKADEILIYTASELTGSHGSSNSRPPAHSTTASTATNAATRKYTVKSGDTLYSIAQKKLKKGSRWKEIYKKNKSIIEKTAKKHGKKSSNNGHWIYPGTKLTIPAK